MTAMAGNSHAFVVQWKELERWVNPYRTLNPRALPKGWGLAKVRDVAKQITTICEVKPDQKYRMVGVKWYGEGTFERESVNGEEISARYLSPVVPDAFIYNRLFAWKASFAVVPKEHRGCFVSNEFPQFTVDESRLNAEYLHLYFTTTKVVRAVEAASVGSAAVSRNRFKEEEFLSFPVPLPPLPVQEAIVAHWRKAREAAAKSRETVARLAAETMIRFFNLLGLKPPKAYETPKAFAVWWKNFFRWSVSYNQAALNSVDVRRGRYRVSRLGELLARVQYGTSEKANKEGRGTPVLRINNIKEGSLDLTELKYIELPHRVLGGLSLADGDILIIRTSGSRDLVGTCAVFHGADRYVFASYLIRLCVDRSKALSDYVAYFINSPLGRQQIDTLSRQIMQNNVNSEELRSLLVPVPPLEVQREIVDTVSRLRARIAEERKAAEERQAQAAREVEEMILGVRPVG